SRATLGIAADQHPAAAARAGAVGVVGIIDRAADAIGIERAVAGNRDGAAGPRPDLDRAANALGPGMPAAIAVAIAGNGRGAGDAGHVDIEVAANGNRSLRRDQRVAADAATAIAARIALRVAADAAGEHVQIAADLDRATGGLHGHAAAIAVAASAAARESLGRRVQRRAAIDDDAAVALGRHGDRAAIGRFAPAFGIVELGQRGGRKIATDMERAPVGGGNRDRARPGRAVIAIIVIVAAHDAAAGGADGEVTAEIDRSIGGVDPEGAVRPGVHAGEGAAVDLDIAIGPRDDVRGEAAIVDPDVARSGAAGEIGAVEIDLRRRRIDLPVGDIVAGGDDDRAIFDAGAGRVEADRAIEQDRDRVGAAERLRGADQVDGVRIAGAGARRAADR